MIYHKYNPETFIYVESVEAEEQPENSTDKPLPEITKQYTVAFIDGDWYSVLKPVEPVIEDETLN